MPKVLQKAQMIGKRSLKGIYIRGLYNKTFINSFYKDNLLIQTFLSKKFNGKFNSVKKPSQENNNKLFIYFISFNGINTY